MVLFSIFKRKEKFIIQIRRYVTMCSFVCVTGLRKLLWQERLRGHQGPLREAVYGYDRALWHGKFHVRAWLSTNDNATSTSKTRPNASYASSRYGIHARHWLLPWQRVWHVQPQITPSKWQQWPVQVSRANLLTAHSSDLTLWTFQAGLRAHANWGSVIRRHLTVIYFIVHFILFSCVYSQSHIFQKFISLLNIYTYIIILWKSGHF